MEKNILVSIVCITYNHENYIEDAINGFLMQKTDFNFEILIHDDASTDNTAKIIRKYEEKYPSLIKVIYQKENQYSQGKALESNLYKMARGKYLAMCEGDDYWIDENKLQKQVDFLENNEEYYATYHNVLIVDEKGKEIDDGRESYLIREEFDIQGIEKNFSFIPGQTASIVSRNFYKDLLEKKIDIDSYKTNGDMKLVVIFLAMGKIKIFKDIMSSYRRSYVGDSWTARTKNKNLSEFFLNSTIELKRLIKDLTGKEIDIKKNLARIFIDSLIILSRNPRIENLKIVFNILKKIPNKFFTIRFVIERGIIKIKNG